MGGISGKINIITAGEAKQSNPGPGTVVFDTGVPVDQYRPGEMIVRLKDEAIVKPTYAYGYRADVLNLLAMLRRDFGAVVKLLWPLGLPVLDREGAPAPAGSRAPVGSPDVKPDSPMFSAPEWVPGLEWVSQEVRTEARLYWLVTIAAPDRMPDALAKTAASPSVSYAEQVPKIIMPVLTPDPFPEPVPPVAPGQPARKVAPPDYEWPMKMVGRPPDWGAAKLANIAVLDSGCDGNHNALKGAVVYGTDESSADTYGHGTFVCGVIAGRPNVFPLSGGSTALPTGVLPAATLWTMKVILPSVQDPNVHEVHAGRYTLALRVLADPKVTDPNVVKVAKAPNNIQVVNLSVWTTQSFWPTETNLINALKTKVIVVASSGNATVAPGNLSQVRHPAALPYAISVGAFCKDGTRWTGTNTAKPDTGRTPEVDIDAPGERILSALPLNMNAKGAKFGGFLTGTSMATPYVTAYVAKLRSDGMSARDVIAGRLKQNSQKKSDGSGKSWYPMKW